MDSKKIRRFLLLQLGRHKKWVFLSIFFALIVSATTVMLGKMIQPFLDKALIPKDMSQIIYTSLFLAGLVFTDATASFFHRFFLRVGVERSILDLRKKIFDKMLIFSQKQWAKIDSGKAVTHIISDTFEIGLGLHLLSDLIRQPLTAIGLTGYLFYLNWKLTIFCIVVLPVIGFLANVLGKSARRNKARIQNAVDTISHYSIESIHGMRTAHSYGRTKLLRNNFWDKISQAYKPGIKLAAVQVVLVPISKVMFGIAGALLLFAGGYLVSRGELSVGEVFSFLVSAGLLQTPIRQLSTVHMRTQEVYASAERIIKILEQPLDSVAQAQNILTQKDFNPKDVYKDALPLEFKNLNFSYDETKTTGALSDVSYTIEPGTKVALVGPSGAGKSTLSLLAMRYLDPLSGEVLLGAKNAKDWPIDKYRAQFSYVSQDVFLFSTTLKENICFANPSATEEEIWDSLEKARLKDFVKSLPEGLNTQVRERASNFSGGEKQRIAIARAMLRNSPIVILDEATSQLDVENEKLIQQALNELTKDRSLVIIAHRLSTIKEADEVIVLENGKILEKGSPQQLIENQETRFSKMWRTQNLAGM